MARKTRVVIKRADGTTVSFLAKNKVTRKVSKAKAAAKPKPAARRVGAPKKKVSKATPAQLDNLAKGRATRTHRKLERMYGAGGGLPVGGPSGVASIVAPDMTSMPSAASVAAMNAGSTMNSYMPSAASVAAMNSRS